MTDSALQPSAPASSDIVQWQGDTGLEDFDQSDMSMPRIGIEHHDAKFKHSLTGETFETIRVIILGLHKSRILWNSMDASKEGDPPLCKSPNMTNGFPLMDPELPSDRNFPWDATKFDPSDARPLSTSFGPTQPSLTCKTCNLKDWGSDPSGNKPWCSEEYTLPILWQDEDDAWNPALFTVKRSGLKAAREYITPFAAKGAPVFQVVTDISLDQDRRGSVKFCRPVFTKVGRTNPADWDGYSESFKNSKAFLGQLPMPREEEEVPEGDVKNNDDAIDGQVVEESAPAPAAKKEPEEQVFSTRGKVKQPPAPQPKAAGNVEIDDDDEPPF